MESKRIQILIGDTESSRMVARIKELDWGRMFVLDKPKPFENEKWGFDNGAFIFWRNNQPFNEDEYQVRLDRARSCTTVKPYLAVIPDKVGKGQESLDFSAKWIEKLPQDWPWYLPVQDGMTPEAVRPFLSKVTGLFLGGTDQFKSTAKVWADLAHAEGKLFHYGRAGTLRKLAHARQSGADSCDSAFPLWTYDRFNAFIRVWENGEEHPMIDWS